MGNKFVIAIHYLELIFLIVIFFRKNMKVYVSCHILAPTFFF